MEGDKEAIILFLIEHSKEFSKEEYKGIPIGDLVDKVGLTIDRVDKAIDLLEREGAIWINNSPRMDDSGLRIGIHPRILMEYDENYEK